MTDVQDSVTRAADAAYEAESAADEARRAADRAADAFDDAKLGGLKRDDLVLLLETVENYLRGIADLDELAESLRQAGGNCPPMLAVPERRAA